MPPPPLPPFGGSLNNGLVSWEANELVVHGNESLSTRKSLHCVVGAPSHTHASVCRSMHSQGACFGVAWLARKHGLCPSTTTGAWLESARASQAERLQC